MSDGIGVHEAEKQVERRRIQNRDAQKRRRDKVRALKIATKEAAHEKLKTARNDSMQVSDLGRLEQQCKPLDPNPYIIETSRSISSERSSEGSFSFDSVISYVKLAERMSTFLDQTTKERLIAALLHQSHRQTTNYQAQHRLPLPISLHLEAESLFSAISMNALRLGFSMEHLQDYEYISDFGERWMMQKQQLLTQNGDTACLGSIPQNMHPTALQLVSKHHPFLDVTFPWPSVRDRLLLASENSLIDEDDLCTDLMIGGTGVNGEPASMMVWGTDPMDLETWEIGEQFAQKWFFLFEREWGPTVNNPRMFTLQVLTMSHFPLMLLFPASIIRRTNWWRKQRGLPPIVIDYCRLG